MNSWDFWDIMNEPLPNSRDFGFDCKPSDPDLHSKAEEFQRTEGYWRWEIAMCEWMIRRRQAELDYLADNDGAYGAWVKRSYSHDIEYELKRIEEYELKIEEIRRAS